MSQRDALLQHVRKVQSDVRSCAGCGMCCTAAHNAVRVLPVEGERIAGFLRGLPAPRAAELLRRAGRAIRRFRLRRGEAALYTCPFLEADATCALPFAVKPVACLSFNPITADRCDQEPRWFHGAHAPVEVENRRRGLPDVSSPIPVAVREALRRQEQDARPEQRRRARRRRGRAWVPSPGLSGSASDASHPAT